MVQPDTGPEFEDRARAIARAIHDPLGLQGAIMHKGREVDAVFVDSHLVVAYEFTKQRAKQKAAEDAKKAVEVAKDVAQRPENRLKATQAFVVTLDEPTAEQRDAVDSVAAASSLSVKILSLVQLKKRLIDVESYIAKRMAAPFGSTTLEAPSGQEAATQTGRFIEARFAEMELAVESTLQDLVVSASAGGRSVVLGDYGTGKSTALFESFLRLRKVYFRDPSSNPIPIHLNLRDMSGTKSPQEMLRRHAEDIGFPDPGQLVAAWRAGNCVLLLDGFDELVPTRWVGGARNLAAVRRNALAPVRRLIAETPASSGVVLAGRAQYFADRHEVLEAVGLVGASVVEVLPFTDNEIDELVEGKGSPLPDWLPRRPALIAFLVEKGLVKAEQDSLWDADPGVTWEKLFEFVAEREAERVDSVTPDSVLRLLARVATITQLDGGARATVTVDQIRGVFLDVCGYEPDEEGLQLVLRLPGLASDGANEREGMGESRRFVDGSLAEAAYGFDLAAYFEAPFGSHPLQARQGSPASMGELAAQVAASRMLTLGYEPGHMKQTLKARLSSGALDAVLLDALRCCDYLGTPYEKNLSAVVEEVIVPNLEVSPDGFLAHATIRDSLIEELVFVEVDASALELVLERCTIGTVSGLTERECSSLLRNSDVASFKASSATNAGILALDLPPEVQVALTILKKTYFQKGAARQESALTRGLPQDLRGLVRGIALALAAAGYLAVTSRKGITLYAPLKDRRAKVAQILAAPPASVFW